MGACIHAGVSEGMQVLNAGFGACAGKPCVREGIQLLRSCSGCRGWGGKHKIGLARGMGARAGKSGVRKGSQARAHPSRNYHLVLATPPSPYSKPASLPDAAPPRHPLHDLETCIPSLTPIQVLSSCSGCRGALAQFPSCVCHLTLLGIRCTGRGTHNFCTLADLLRGVAHFGPARTARPHACFAQVSRGPSGS